MQILSQDTVHIKLFTRVKGLEEQKRNLLKAIVY